MESALQMMESSSRVHTSSRHFKAHAATIFPQDLFVAMEEIEPCFYRPLSQLAEEMVSDAIQ